MLSIMRGLLAALIFCTGAAAVFAQNFPTRPLRIIVPTAPGGGLDFVARLIGPKLTQSMGQTVVVDNRPGASGVIGLELTARATPDGYNLMVISATHVIYSAINKTSFDFFKDFAPISQLTAANYVLVVTPPLPLQSVRELIAYAKTNPGKLNYASSGVGSLQHLATEYLGSIEGVKFTHVPYKGVGAAIPDLVSGRIQMTMSSITSMNPHIRAKRLRPLAVTGTVRSPVLPGVPTMIEAGVKDFVVTQWIGVIAPAGTPQRVTQYLYQDFSKALKQPDVATRLARDGTDPIGSSPKTFAAFMRDESTKWLKVARQAGIPIRK
ncbi:MAG: tripartite tricarboxylate transporter substrate binding protein [Betaproteobacteria bacterium]|nr:tripartite tricarboxylate transporter substrate binding protein [Gammaproteobacteria bacterium]MDH3436617.1 tripartite tricarboxylate transporter substrate binding protein [Betaproteobacteria bacterium]